MQTVAPLGVPDRCSTMGLEKARIMALSHWLRGLPARILHAGKQLRWGREALEAKIMKNAHRVGNPR